MATRRREQQAFVAVLDGLGSALRSGAGPQQAVREVARRPGVEPAGLGSVVGALDRGVPLAEALAQWSSERRAAERTLVAAALGTGLSTGGALARAADRAAATVRERMAVEREARAMAAQATTSAMVVACAPLAFGVLVVVADPSMAAFLLGTPVGWLCLTVGLGLDVLGALWMTVLVRRVS
ncbi:MAG: type II secretion system F family protein [Acidimicrobiia bacterium]|nr:type II secretion system F family protein [Acidimicrobiia bacterium]